MANIKSSIKDVRRSAGRNARNRSAKARMRTFCKKVLEAVDAKDVQGAQDALRSAVSVLASAARKRIIHRNTASRQTLRLNAKVKHLALSATAS